MTQKTDEELDKWPKKTRDFTVGGDQIDQKKKWQLPSSANTQYNHNTVVQTKSGHLIEYDDTPGAERIRILHKAGSFVEMRPDGSVQFRTNKNKYEVVAGDSNMIVQGTINIQVQTANIKVAGDCKAEVAGDFKGTVGGNWNMEVSGDTTLNTSGDVKITGSTIRLN